MKTRFLFSRANEEGEIEKEWQEEVEGVPLLNDLDDLYRERRNGKRESFSVQRVDLLLDGKTFWQEVTAESED